MQYIPQQQPEFLYINSQTNQQGLCSLKQGCVEIIRGTKQLQQNNNDDEIQGCQCFSCHANQIPNAFNIKLEDQEIDDEDILDLPQPILAKTINKQKIHYGNCFICRKDFSYRRSCVQDEALHICSQRCKNHLNRIGQASDNFKQKITRKVISVYGSQKYNQQGKPLMNALKVRREIQDEIKEFL